ncbi:MAG TPA: HEAT repeat domain-containing protein [Deltaproteobacteria bacterium]|nr:HEAT repeat domain-containing protein [Deltaproteobacteria bacterium]
MMKISRTLLPYVSRDTPRNERLRAARALVPMSLEERLTALCVLARDGDDEVRREARNTLAAVPEAVLASALEDGGLDPEVASMLRELHGGLAAGGAAAPGGPADGTPGRGEKAGDAGKGGSDAPRELTLQKEHLSDEELRNVYKLVGSLSMAEKIKLAMTGNKEARELLIKDSNKMVALSVLKNPRITDQEILRVASDKSASDDVLRAIARTKEWLKSYPIKHALVLNPKTPPHIAMKLVDHLYEKDLAKLAKSRNVPGIVAATARRRLEAKKH